MTAMLVGPTPPRQVNFRRGPGRDPEILEELRLAPPTARELAGQESILPTDLEIFRHKVDAIVDEARTVFKALAMAETLQIGDDCVSLFTAMGDMAATATGVYFHAVLNDGPIKYILKHYRGDPTVGVQDGDIFFYNETLCGTIHPYDMFVAMPIFCDGELVAWAAAGGHQGEAGSRNPGGFVPTATSKYEEGIRITPLKIGERFCVKTDHLECLANAVRNPVQLALDVKTRVAVCLRVRERLLREIERRGLDFVVAGLRQLLVTTSDLARRRLEALSDGVFRAVVFLDTIGTEDGLLRVPVTLTKRGDRLTIDFSGASPEHRRGPSHMYWHVVRAVTAVYLFSFVFRGLPLNIGLFEPVDVLVPPGTFLNAGEDVAHGQDSFTGRVCVQALHLACARLIFDSELRDLAAAPFSANLVEYLFGGRDQYGAPVAGVPSSINAQGQGARHDLDGEHTMGFFWAPEVDCLSAEENEAKFPWLYLSRNLFDGNVYGFGRQRGGVGMTDVFFVHGAPDILMTSIGHGSRFSLSPGLFGGYMGAPTPRITVTGAGVKARMAAGDPDLPYGLMDLLVHRRLGGETVVDRAPCGTRRYTENDLLVMHAGSGGGYGDVLDRRPELVAADVAVGMLAPELARSVYGVALDPDTGAVHDAETAALRTAIRQERLERGAPYDQFIAGWSAMKPPAEVLKLYGPWPQP